jgi:hypothetical protein
MCWRHFVSPSAEAEGLRDVALSANLEILLPCPSPCFEICMCQPNDSWFVIGSSDVSENLDTNFCFYKAGNPRKLNCIQSLRTFQTFYKTNSWNIQNNANGSYIFFDLATNKSSVLFVVPFPSDCLRYRQPNVHCRVPTCLRVDSGRLTVPWRDLLDFLLSGLL